MYTTTVHSVLFENTCYHVPYNGINGSKPWRP